MIWAVTTFTFFIISVMPGDPVAAAYDSMLQQGMSPESAAALVEQIARMRPTGSVWEQYLDYVGTLLSFDLGQSMGPAQIDVSTLLANDIKWTIVPLFLSITLSFVLGVGMGLIAAVKRSGKVGDSLAISASLINGLPPYLIALLFGSTFIGILPIFPRGSTVGIEFEPGFTADYIGSLVYHAALPIAAYMFTAVGGFVLTMRSSVVTVLGDDFILAAELRGMTKTTVRRYITRNAILPLFTIFTISLAAMFSGAVYIEQIFNYSGLGVRMIESIGYRDITVMAGALLLITVSIIVANILADILYTVIDPRIRRGGEAA
jgi:peptide/nickel transport system permease protein